MEVLVTKSVGITTNQDFLLRRILLVECGLSQRIHHQTPQTSLLLIPLLPQDQWASMKSCLFQTMMVMHHLLVNGLNYSILEQTTLTLTDGLLLTVWGIEPSSTLEQLLQTARREAPRFNQGNDESLNLLQTHAFGTITTISYCSMLLP